MTQLEHWIGGTAVAATGGAYFDDLNPVDDSVYSRVPAGTAEDVNRAVENAHQAYLQHRDLPAAVREGWIAKAAEIMERDTPKFADVLVDEIGSPIAKAGFETRFAISFLRAAIGVPRRVRGETIPSDTPGRFSMSLRQPVGVVAGITPFNVPLIKGIKQSAMALATGNAFVLLPSEAAPMIADLLAKLWKEAGVPDGLFNVVYGNGAEIGDVLTGHPKVASITFTGSSRVGKHIAEIAARNLKKYTLELGGKSPLVICADADLDKAVNAALFSIFMYQGQVCMGASRIYVERPIFDQFAKAFAAATSRAKSGDLREPTTMLGPIISERQRDRVRRHIDDARSKGAAVLAGGEWSGNSCAATILSGVTAEMTVFEEETFGPVTSLYPFDTLEEALELANSTEYGLSASIFTRDLDKALAFAQRAESGMVHINAPTLHDEPHVPFGGTKASGFGREGTEADLEIMTEWKWVTIQSATAGAGGH
ncbi:aldehyde dehydrogenase family protein [Novosphingobium sp. KCTC 2891]|jgi:acyl-CoA reductase-like NAD-dependent aldehyde dehydrogenase|uniref:aldehyde dehydrogenase family protein n=1 Tax=Novosphingobium sp. KCTC 2891 TaxID=2989730 RepID=UPI002223DD5D|nr:aldehyde dehydrogenase family protein [Novosphingobium sp. KCTC 2891]MCW1384347.1 aldehyde dehydrogenase family protein [Novosphingobium sp. KCTC 2891]